MGLFGDLFNSAADSLKENQEKYEYFLEEHKYDSEHELRMALKSANSIAKKSALRKLLQDQGYDV